MRVESVVCLVNVVGVCVSSLRSALEHLRLDLVFPKEAVVLIGWHFVCGDVGEFSFVRESLSVL